MKRLALPLTVALCLSLFPTLVGAQTPQTRTQPSQPQAARSQRSSITSRDSRTQAVIDRSERLYEMGEAAFGENDLDQARRSFDDAVDAILTSGLDVRSNDDLQSYYRELVEKVHQHQMLAHDGTAAGFADQAYVPAESELARLSDADLAALNVDASQTVDGSYNFQFTVGQPVFSFISYFTQGRGRGTMETGLRRSGRYRKMAERIFKEEGVPTDLIWLAQVESVWKPAALSSAAAKGIWQFIPSTGRRFGLDQDYWVDERCDPEQSTRAAARYLKFLHDYFAGDWLLAMAAYNSGEGNVSKAIARSGYADFWEIHNAGFLPNETRNYVPAILAVIIVSHNQQRYGFNVAPDSPINYDVATISDQTDIDILADLAGTSGETIRDLNPHLRRNTTPPGSFSVKIPVGKKKDFEVAYAALPPDQRLRRATPSVVADDTVAENGDDNGGRDRRATFSGSNSTVSYTARKGDSLTSVANRYGVSTTELAQLNRISATDDLEAGQVLKVPAPQSNSRYKEQPASKKSYRAKPERSSSKSSKTSRSSKSSKNTSAKGSKGKDKSSSKKATTKSRKRH